MATRIRRHHVRTPNPPTIHITENDEQFFIHWIRFGYVSPELMAALTNRDYDTVKDRMRALMPRHYSTQYNPSHYELPKHWPNFYTIGQNGLKYAKTHELLPPHYLNLSKKTYKKANTILKHDYQASNFVASISAALPPLYTVGYRQDIVQMSQTTPTLSVPYSFTHRNNKSQTKTYKGYFINDQAFYIKRPDEHISYFGVEIQNTSNTGEFTDDLTRSTALAKMYMFNAAHKAREHNQKFGIRKWRHIFIVRSEEIMRNMANMAEQHFGPTNLFLFAHTNMNSFKPKLELAEYAYHRAGYPPIKLTDSTR